ncbi:MAG: hypothetical protein SFY68_11725 [Candidatus Sumerlaeia bacterium]|nr:hypothetical protein [Candidatus Sumerlaeia bacterium]
MRLLNRFFRKLNRSTRRLFLTLMVRNTAVLLLIAFAGTLSIGFGYHVLDVVYRERPVTQVVIKPREAQVKPRVFVPPATIEFPIY